MWINGIKKVVRVTIVEISEKNYDGIFFIINEFWIFVMDLRFKKEFILREPSILSS